MDKFDHSFIVEPLEERIAPAVFVVANDLDFGDGSLRDAILKANESPDKDVIRFDKDFFSEPRTIEIRGVLLIGESVKIIGPGSDLLTIDGQDFSPGFTIYNADGRPKNVHIEGLTVTHAYANYFGDFLDRDTAAITNYESLSLRDVVVSDNKGLNGGLYSAGGDGGNLSIRDCSFIDNESRSNGAGVTFSTAGTVRILDSVISGNISSLGAGIYGTTGGLNAKIKIFRTDVDQNLGEGMRFHGSSTHLSLVIKDSSFSENTGISGLTIKTDYGSKSVVRLDGVAVSSNEQVGGSITMNEKGSLIIKRSQFIDNGTNPWSKGGLILLNIGDALIDRTVIKDNHSVGTGGGLSIYGSSVDLSRSEISGNSSESEGGGIYMVGMSNLNLSETVVTGNISGTQGGGLAISNSPFPLGDTIGIFGNTAPKDPEISFL